MFKWLESALVYEPAVHVDPAQFGDPLAAAIDWSPLKVGGASLCTHRLLSVGPVRCVFQATWRARVFYLVFVLAGLSGLLTFLPVHTYFDGLGPYRLVPALISLVVGVAGATMFYLGTQPIVFDKSRGAYWTGRKEPAKKKKVELTQDGGGLERVRALQLLVERVRGNSSTYDSYELNIVFEDAVRVNVLDHSGLSQLRRDAQGLAEFLNVPLWDGTRRE